MRFHAKRDQFDFTEGDKFGSRAVKPTEQTAKPPRSAKRINSSSPKVMNSVSAVRLMNSFSPKVDEFVFTEGDESGFT